MDSTNETTLPPYGRLIAAGLFIASAIGLALNHFAVQRQSVAAYMILILAPLGVLLGLGGMVEPRIVWSLGEYGQHLPAKFKVIGLLLAAVGVIITLVLVFFVYPLVA